MQPVEGAIEAPGALTVQRLDRRPVDAVQLDVVRAVAAGTDRGGGQRKSNNCYYYMYSHCVDLRTQNVTKLLHCCIQKLYSVTSPM